MPPTGSVRRLLQPAAGLSEARYARLLLLAFALWIAILSLLGGDTHRPGTPGNDYSNFFHIWADFLHRWLQRGVVPWWNPHAFGGYPVLETVQPMLAYPPWLAMIAPLPPGLALNALTAFHLIVALYGFAYFARAGFGIGPLGAAVGGVLYALAGVMAVRVTAGHVTVVGVMAWWPWALAGWHGHLARLPRRGGLWLPNVRTPEAQKMRGPIALSSLAVALCILAGAPQYVAYLGYLMLVGGLAHGLAMGQWRLARPLRWPIQMAVSLGVAWLPALLISAPAWLPALEYLPFSVRADDLGTGGAAFPTDKLFLTLGTFLAFPLGDDVSRPHLGRSNVWETALYLGAGAAALTLGLWLAWGISRMRARQIEAWRLAPVAFVTAAIAVLSLLLIDGLPLPGLSRFRDPIKARVLLHLALALGTAAALDHLLRQRPAAPVVRSVLAMLLATATGLLVLLAACRLIPEALGTAVLPVAGSFDLLAAAEFARHIEYPELVSIRLSTAALRSLGYVAVLCLLVAIANSRLDTVLRRDAGAILAAVIIIDAVAPHINAISPVHPVSAHTLSQPVRDDLLNIEREIRETGQPYRVSLPSLLMNRGAYFDMIYDTGGYDPLMPRNGNNRGVVAAVIGLSEPDSPATSAFRRGMASRVQGRRMNFIPQGPAAGLGIYADDWATLDTAAAIDLANAPDAAIHTLLSPAAGDSIIVANPQFPPYGPDIRGSHILQDRPQNPSSDAEGSNPAATRFLQTLKRGDRPDLAAPVATTTSSLHNSLQVLPPTAPHRVEMRIDPPLDQPALLLSRITWLPGWRWRTDGGGSGRPLLVNGWAVGVPLPAGATDVTLSYLPSHLEFSVTLTALGLIIAVMMAFPLYRHRRSAR